MKSIFTLITAFICLFITFSAHAQTSDFDGNNGLNVTTSGMSGAVSNSSTSDPSGGGATFGISGTNGYRVNNGTGTVTTGVLTTTAGSSFSFRLASLSGSSGNGADGGDFVRVEISTDGGTTYSSELQVNGNSNAQWTYAGGTGTATGTYDGNNTATVIATASGGVLTTNGLSTVTLTGLPSATNLVIRITMTNNDANEYWAIDNLTLSSSTSKTVQFTNTTYTVNENASAVNATVCVSITNPDATATMVNVVLTGGTAINGTDISNYTTQTVTFPANTSTNQCITFTVTDDALTEISETLIFTLQNATGAASIGSPSTTTVTIADNDVANIVITEILYDPCSGSAPNFWPNEGDGEFVEIYNNGSTTVDISGWRITDNDSGSFNYIFPGAAGSATTIMPPGTYMVIARQVLYQALDTNTDNIIDAGNAGAGSKIFNEDATEGASTGGDLNNDGDDVELEDAAGNTLDLVVYDDINPWATCASSNDGISLSLLNPSADNSLSSNWYPSLTNGAGAGAAGGGSPGASNTGGACLSNVTANANQTNCGTASPSTIINVTFTTNYSAVSSYDIYRNGNFLATYNVGSTAAGTYTYTSPNLAPVSAGTENFEVRPASAPANSCFTANDNVTITGCTLPIELWSFEGKSIRTFIQLNWSTATETNNAYIEVQRSADGVQFYPIGQVPGHGTTAILQFYNFTDQQPLPGINYYRLRQVDTDGRAEYHKIIAVKHENTAKLMHLYPTEAKDVLNVAFSESLSGTSILKIVDLTGRVLKHYRLLEEVQQLVIEVLDLPQSAYFLQLESRYAQETLRFVKF